MSKTPHSQRVPPLASNNSSANVNSNSNALNSRPQLKLSKSQTNSISHTVFNTRTPKQQSPLLTTTSTSNHNVPDDLTLISSLQHHRSTTFGQQQQQQQPSNLRDFPHVLPTPSQLLVDAARDSDIRSPKINKTPSYIKSQDYFGLQLDSPQNLEFNHHDIDNNTINSNNNDSKQKSDKSIKDLSPIQSHSVTPQMSLGGLSLIAKNIGGANKPKIEVLPKFALSNRDYNNYGSLDDASFDQDNEDSIDEVSYSIDQDTSNLNSRSNSYSDVHTITGARSFVNTLRSIRSINFFEGTTSNEENTNSVQQRNYYDDFTTMDWVDDYVRVSGWEYVLKQKSIKNLKYKIYRTLEHAQPFILVCVVSFFSSLLVYSMDRFESTLVDWKRGYCQTNWLIGEKVCCAGSESPVPFAFRTMNEGYCPSFILWKDVFDNSQMINPSVFNFLIYILLTVMLAYFSVLITLTTKTTNALVDAEESSPSDKMKNKNNNNNNSYVDNEVDVGEHRTENGENEYSTQAYRNSFNNNSTNGKSKPIKRQFKTIYTAYGSGVPEVKTILSGFIIRKFLGTYTLIAKSTALVFAIASGMNLGKEGPYVHLATCIGNISCRLFKRFHKNGLEKRIILSAAASAGVALAFGSPLGAVLFAIEEVTYYLQVSHLFLIFLCSMISVLFLKFLDPYKTGKPVLFEITYTSDWEPIELIFFVIIGICGGLFGGFFCKFTQFWASWYRNKKFIKGKYVREVLIIAVLTAFLTYNNDYTRQPVNELLFQLATPCTKEAHCSLIKDSDGILIIKIKDLINEVSKLSSALLIKIILTSITFGIKVPLGIYIPSMAIGALFGRIFATVIQISTTYYPFMLSLLINKDTPSDTVVDFGIYSIIGAGAFMAGVTRMNVTLATILFELTSSYTYVLPISIAIAFSNWVAYHIEPNSLYEILIEKNDFPFLDNRKILTFDNSTKLKDLLTVNSNIINDSILVLPQEKENNTNSGETSLNVNASPDHSLFTRGLLGETNLITASVLRSKLLKLQEIFLIDGCLSIVDSDSKLIGLLPLTKLEYQLDKIDRFAMEYNISEEIPVKLKKSDEDQYYVMSSNQSDYFSVRSYETNVADERVAVALLNKLTDFSNLIDYTPIILDSKSPISLVQLVFSKLGNTEICVLDDNKFVGTLHKKIFIDYCRNTKPSKVL
ncbi:hypothetical protein B5S28_g3166 [[Candida] boidinii]|nr:hypothetical protein B5S28_g3166 [[Candida] boidinii]